jgi:hypothetical protein
MRLCHCGDGSALKQLVNQRWYGDSLVFNHRINLFQCKGLSKP